MVVEPPVTTPSAAANSCDVRPDAVSITTATERSPDAIQILTQRRPHQQNQSEGPPGVHPSRYRRMGRPRKEQDKADRGGLDQPECANSVTSPEQKLNLRDRPKPSSSPTSPKSCSQAVPKTHRCSVVILCCSDDAMYATGRLSHIEQRHVLSVMAGRPTAWATRHRASGPHTLRWVRAVRAAGAVALAEASSRQPPPAVWVVTPVGYGDRVPITP